MAQTFYKERQL